MLIAGHIVFLISVCCEQRRPVSFRLTLMTDRLPAIFPLQLQLHPLFYVDIFWLFSTKLRIKSLLQPNHIFRSVMPDHTLSFLNFRRYFSTDVVPSPLVSRLGSSYSEISIRYQITCLLLSFLLLLIRE